MSTNRISIDWEYAHLASDLKAGPQGKGCYLGNKIHWSLSKNNIQSNAQLIKIGDNQVAHWEFKAIETLLHEFLRNNEGPKHRILIFQNNPSINRNNNCNPSVINQYQSQANNNNNSNQYQNNNNNSYSRNKSYDNYGNNSNCNYNNNNSNGNTYNRNSNNRYSGGYQLHKSYNRDSSNNSNVLQQILDQLSYPTKMVYNPRDIVWVQLNNDTPMIAIIKFTTNNGYIIRPFGKNEQKEIYISSKQIISKPNGQISTYELKQIIDSIQCENNTLLQSNVNEIYYNTLVKYNDNVFANIMSKNDNGTYDIKIHENCTWNTGPQIIQQVTRHQIAVANEYELKYCAEILKSQPFDSDDSNEMNIYWFLDEIGNLYIREFIKNGFTNISFLLLITEQDLIQMGVKMAHRRFILHKIQSYNKDQFDIIRKQKQIEREEIQGNNYVSTASSDESESKSENELLSDGTNDIEQSEETEYEYEDDGFDKGVSHELLEELLVYGYIRQNAGNSFKFKFSKDLLDLCLEWYHIESCFMLVGNQCTLDHNRTIVEYNGADITNIYKSKGEIIKQPNSCYNSIIMPSITETDIEYIYTLKILECEDVVCIGLDSTNGDYINDDFSSKKTTYHYSYYSKGGTAWNKTNAVNDKRTYENSGYGHTFAHAYRKGDIITMHYNPYKSKGQLWYEKNGESPQYSITGMNIHKQMGLQYRLCIFMGGYGKQTIELINYQRIGDIDEESETESNDSNDIVAQTDQSDI